MMTGMPEDQGLYEARREHDACGIGAVVNIAGQRSHAIVAMANEVLMNLQHRGAAGADETTGDGAGMLLQIPQAFLAEEFSHLDIALPDAEAWGAGMVFLPADERARRACTEAVAQAAAHYGLAVLGWREVPCDNACLGDLARQAEPVVRQVAVDGGGRAGEALEDRLYLARRRAERLIRRRLGAAGRAFHVASLSCRTICYKGMFLAPQLTGYYRDLSDQRVVTALAVVHQRYSTNTFPSWSLAQPFRCIAHNGEINTLSGNRNRMRARERRMASPKLGGDLTDLLPVLPADGSDSACFDAALELLVRAGRSMPHAMMMMIPEAFGPAYHISADKRAFYEYHAAIMEPWDGPAAILFTDGRLLGGTLDRNGLRPCRYVETADGLVVMGSEAGVIDFPPQRVVAKGRLQPGRMFLVDTVEGRVVTDNEIKSKIARQKPYRRWLEDNRIELRGLYDAAAPAGSDPQRTALRMRQFGYTREELTTVLAPMGANGQEPIGSMGNDTPLAVLSRTPRSLFDYFRQQFAQVTNPPIDPLREGLVMSVMSYTGKRRNLLDESPEHCRQLKLAQPILTSEDMQRLRAVRRGDFKVATIETLFDAGAADPAAALREAVGALIRAAVEAIAGGASLLILSDRRADTDRAAIPALLALSAVHHALLEDDLRGEVGLVVESGEPRQVQHFCLLLGFGADAVNPYLAFEALDLMQHTGEIDAAIEASALADHYIAAVKKGILKVMSKMGISTLRSYRSAQLFEAVGLNRELIDAYFKGTSSRIGGLGLAELAAETLARHREALRPRKAAEPLLPYGGDYHYRADGTPHLWNPATIAALHQAVRANDPKAYAAFAEAVNDRARHLCTLRGLFEFVEGDAVPLEEVEPAAEIVKRFCTGAMSHGSLSQEVHEDIAVAMNRIGAMSNTGEGGEEPHRYASAEKNSAVKQVASGRFGVSIDYLAHAREIQIKMAQGAKPGEGGHLPGYKVTGQIARMRFSTPGVTLISPPPHHDIYSIEDLAQLIYDLKCSNPGVKVSVKLVSEVGVGTIAAGVAKGNADEVLISGADGGTGSSPLSSIHHAGAPWELGLAETQQVLLMNGLRDRIRVQTDGQIRTGRDVVIAALLGAEQFGFGTAALVAMGCVLMRKCHLGTCPVGIATQNPALRGRYTGQPEHLERYMFFVAEDVRRRMAALGFRTVDEMIGRADRLDTAKAIDHYKARGLDFSAIFHRPALGEGASLRRTRRQADTLAGHTDWAWIQPVREAIDRGERIVLRSKIRNVHRTVGTILSSRLVKACGPDGLADDTVTIELTGSAGQSFGAFLTRGVTLKLTGDSNDYLGKGLSGGRIIVRTPPEAPLVSHENIIVGNTLLYGATGGEAFIGGMAGERFAVRNSGATAVVEGVGDHGCEYMTGGVVVVLGATGRNFAAGMSGGVAYVLDDQQLFDTRCNL
ncbi:MAG: glutamate synthase large subunit, partial [Planctomycetes bacterium]|nr:glutamate synthase large subunit [Planctomycetota bacterium]